MTLVAAGEGWGREASWNGIPKARPPKFKKEASFKVDEK